MASSPPRERLKNDQIQPASIDVRLGTTAYRVPASFLPGPTRKLANRLAEVATHEVDLTRPQVLEKNCVHIIPLQERLKFAARARSARKPKELFRAPGYFCEDYRRQRYCVR
ncbi:MAG: 2'-deoxycytidine 5'-triphosphate deaminase [Methylovirgula sp.]